ncbi:nucleoside deaminase [Clostridium sp. MT-14]|jgi:tRNA(adenine34) deaminase|uniref:nucleoside deaminase n=1 Tax=unclassified Clostridium TaxID=2614128 RepID=UPI0012384C0F|nr:nucleoside deaminase [Clostridium sp. HV4-5-A1G]KAA8666383.1 nucleoside deaminase [Clostridium sp. HV4-5-A1G]CAB1262798.1 tRNA specific adenosine A34 deaminase [Clostridiaceae bacterium BL-3]
MDFMAEALKQAKIALELGEVPVGAVIIKNHKIISEACNLRETLKDPTAHAEIIAIRDASKVLEDWRLEDCSMYVTLEPCAMCAGAILQCRISRLYIGTFDPDAGACGSVVNILQNEFLNHWTDIHWTYRKECSDILKRFFKNRR